MSYNQNVHTYVENEEKLFRQASNDIDTMILSRVKDPGMLRGPLVVSLEITSACNLRCAHCRAADNISHQQNKSMHSALYEETIRQLSDIRPVRIGITGGEPLLHQEAVSFLSTIKKAGLSFVLYTNGTLLTCKIARELSDIMQEDDLIHLSIDGGNADAHDRQRGLGAFAMAMRAIDYIKKYTLPFRITTVPTKNNIDSMDDLINLVIQAAPSSFSAVPLMCAGRAKDNNLEVDIHTLLENESEIIRKLRGKVTYLGGVVGPFCRLLELSEVIDLARFLPRSPSPIRICDACLGQIYIDCRGDVYPCNLFASEDKFCMGSVLHSTIEDIWRSSKWKQLRQGVKMDDTCTKCDLWHICNGGCMALSYLWYKRLDRADPRCPLTKDATYDALQEGL